jgi:hypothetical protein
MITTILIICVLLFLTIFGIVWYLFTPPTNADRTEFCVVPVTLDMKHPTIVDRNTYYAVMWKRYLFWHYFFDRKDLNSRITKSNNDTHLLLFHTQNEAMSYIMCKYPLNSILWKEPYN